jgi:SAM-dependent methyltransferase
MAPAGRIPPARCAALERSGYARLRDLDDPEYACVVRAMEGYQAEFLARTRELWGPDFPISPDALGHFSRQWEYPYAWVNLGPADGPVLDAGSGLTFFPFLLASAGRAVTCCDSDGTLGLPARYAEAAARTGCAVAFTDVSLAERPFDDGTFGAAACISVLEHVGDEREAVIESLATALRPGGRLVLTLDVDLRGDGDLGLEDAAVVLAELGEWFDFVHPLDLGRPPDLLTSEAFLSTATWRLPRVWRPSRTVRPAAFRTVAVLAVTAVKR